MARQPALGTQPMHGGEEALQSGERLFTLEASQLGRPLFACIVPACRNDCLLIGGVFRRVQFKSSLSEQSLVHAGRTELEMARRTAHGQLFLGDKSSDHNRISHQQSAAGAQHPVPVVEKAPAVSKMAENVHADQRIEVAFGKREWLADVSLAKGNRFLHSRLPGERLTGFDAGFADVDARHAATGLPRQEQGRPARAAADVQDVLAGTQREHPEESAIFVACDPTTLSEVLAVSFFADFLNRSSCEVTISGAVQIDGRGHALLLDRFGS